MDAGREHIAPLAPGRATEKIRMCARSDDLLIRWTDHAKDQMAERDLIMGDVLHVLRRSSGNSDRVLQIQNGKQNSQFQQQDGTRGCDTELQSMFGQNRFRDVGRRTPARFVKEREQVS
jgi:hypothetical protein